MMTQNHDFILVVDDDKLTRRMVVKHLTKAGFTTLDAENGEEGLALYQEHKPPMILLDVMMPVMDGYEACKRLREMDSTLSLNILMLTGRDDLEAVEKAFQVGATDFMAKPINWPLLTQRVRFGMRSRQMYLELKEKQHRLHEAQRIAKLGHFLINLEKRSLSLTPEITSMLALSMSELDLADFSAMLPTEDAKRFENTLSRLSPEQPGYIFEHKIKIADGGNKVIAQRGEIRQESGTMLIHATMQDITEQAKAEERLLFHTYYDILTGLPNRLMFENQLAEACGNNNHVALFFIGIDRFKSIVDSLGHHQSDALLKQLAQRLGRFQKPDVLVSRFSDDQFAVAFVNHNTSSALNDLGIFLLKAISEPLLIQGRELNISGSIGIAQYPQETDNIEKLMAAAGLAVTTASNNGGNQFRYFSPEMNAQAQARLALEQDLRHALKNEELIIHYQPQFCALRQEIVGMEALVRWQHPDKGMISPGEFIPLAEETGLVIPLGEQVLRKASQQAVQWHKAGYPVRLGINLSSRQLALPDIDLLIKDNLNDTGINPSLLDLEITESMAIGDYENTISTLDKIRAMGVQTSMDDFGTGYSSLSYLQKLPLNTLKIDRAFIKDITDDGQNGEIAKMIIALSKSLKLHIIAEGVETESQYHYLKNEGADEIQGFYFSKPLPKDGFFKMLSKFKPQSQANSRI